jgi:hypothetical protein
MIDEATITATVVAAQRRANCFMSQLIYPIS